MGGRNPPLFLWGFNPEISAVGNPTRRDDSGLFIRPELDYDTRQCMPGCQADA